MPILSKFLLGSDKDDGHGHGHVEKKKDAEGHELKDMSGSQDDAPSFHDMLIHPNFDQNESVAAPTKKKQNA